MAGIILIPAILLFLPFDFFDHRGPICLFTLLSGYECPGCGMTRACQRIIHFRYREAATFNKMALFIFPILAILWLKEGWDTFQQLRKNSSAGNA